LRNVLLVVLFNKIVLHKSVHESFLDAKNQVVTISTNYDRKNASKRNIKAKLTRRNTFDMNNRKS
jgi:hypothetical protein